MEVYSRAVLGRVALILGRLCYLSALLNNNFASFIFKVHSGFGTMYVKCQTFSFAPGLSLIDACSCQSQIAAYLITAIILSVGYYITC